MVSTLIYFNTGKRCERPRERKKNKRKSGTRERTATILVYGITVRSHLFSKRCAGVIKRLLLRARVPFTECGTELEIVSRIFQHLPVFSRFVGILFFRNKGPLRYALDARKEDRRKGTPILAGGASQKVPKRAFSRVDETYRKAQKVMGLFTRRRAGVTLGV